MARDDYKSVRCSFCGKHQEQVERVIAGPGAYICNECVRLCMNILGEDYDDGPDEAPEIPDVIPTPRRWWRCWTSILSGRRTRRSRCP